MRTLLRFLLLVALLVAAWWVARTYQMQDDFLQFYLSYHYRLPSWISFEQFLIALILLAGVLLAAVVGVSVLGYLFMQRRVQQAQRRQAAQEAALQRALDRLREQVQQEYERLIGLSTTLTQRLDKRAILQNVLQAASQMTSLPHADSAVGLWVLDFDTERMKFETGIRCEDTYFTKNQFELVEQPLTRLVSTKEVMRFQTWQEGFPFLVPEKAARLGEANAVLLIPLIIERTVLGFMVIFCQPDLLKTYQAQEKFFIAAWGQLTLALAIAIQGELAIRDRLTGAVNQGYFFKRLSQEIDRCNRYQLAVGLLMIDIDNFKSVNDTLGHPQGDAVLKIVSKLIKKEVRAIDLVGRYGGEEFVVMLPETGSAEDAGGSSGALIVAERIRTSIQDEFGDLQKPLSVTVSIGVAVRRHPQEKQMDARDVIRVADEQLYRAKAGGKNRCCVHTPTETESVA